MDEELIGRFLALVEAGSISTASRRLYRSGSSLSRDLDRLERSVGAKLVVRGAGGLTVTAAGQEFKVEAVALLGQMRRARGNAQRTAAGEGPLLRIGHVGSMSYRLLPPALRGLRGAFPSLRFSLREALTAEVVGQLGDDRLDVVLARPPIVEAGLAEELLTTDALVAVVPAGHGLAGRHTVALEDLTDVGLVSFPRAASPTVHDRLLAMFAQAGVEIGVDLSQGAQSADGAANAMVMVAAGLGVAVTTASAARAFAQSGVVVCEIRPAPAGLPLSVVWRRDDTNPFVAALVGLLRDQAAETSPRAQTIAGWTQPNLGPT